MKTDCTLIELPALSDLDTWGRESKLKITPLILLNTLADAVDVSPETILHPVSLTYRLLYTADYFRAAELSENDRVALYGIITTLLLQWRSCYQSLGLNPQSHRFRFVYEGKDFLAMQIETKENK